MKCAKPKEKNNTNNRKRECSIIKNKTKQEKQKRCYRSSSSNLLLTVHRCYYYLLHCVIDLFYWRENINITSTRSKTTEKNPRPSFHVDFKMAYQKEEEYNRRRTGTCANVSIIKVPSRFFSCRSGVRNCYVPASSSAIHQKIRNTRRNCFLLLFAFIYYYPFVFSTHRETRK